MTWLVGGEPRRGHLISNIVPAKKASSPGRRREAARGFKDNTRYHARVFGGSNGPRRTPRKGTSDRSYLWHAGPLLRREVPRLTKLRSALKRLFSSHVWHRIALEMSRRLPQERISAQGRCPLVHRCAGEQAFLYRPITRHFNGWTRSKKSTSFHMHPVRSAPICGEGCGKSQASLEETLRDQFLR